MIFGRTNSCELGLSLTCEPALYGPTKNPWDTTRISGGSSGGAAAAVGARMLPMAHASDGFGSIRAPASCCGIVGLKPTRSRNTMAPYAGEGLGGLSTEHAVTLSVRDSAALLDATRGSWPRRPVRRARTRTAVSQRNRRRSGEAQDSVHERRAQWRAGRSGQPAGARRGGEAVRRPRPSRRGSRTGD